MRVQNLFKAGLATLLVLTITACGSNNTDSDVDTEAVSTTTSTEIATPVATATGTGSELSAELRSQQLAEAERDQALSMTVFYFEFNRSELDAASRDALVYHAGRLKDNPGMRVRLEGHADERGTREYNIALGERRAQAIERYLLVQGVSSIQMETISYGEESPVDNGSSEAAYARNRRVELR